MNVVLARPVLLTEDELWFEIARIVLDIPQMEALSAAIKLVGGTQASLADAINRGRPQTEELGQSAISNWMQRGRVPAERVLDVAIATGYRVTPHALRSDLYPHPDDGLPAELRGRMS